MSEDRDKLWLEDEIERKLQKSAEEQPIPQSLLPENVVERLKEEQVKVKREKGRRQSRYILHFTEMAAAVALIVMMGTIIDRIGLKDRSSEDSTSVEMVVDDAAMDCAESACEEMAGMDDAGASENLWQNGGGEAECELENYWVASSYEEIYDCVRKLQQQYKYEYSASGEIADGTINDMAVPEENASSDIICDMGTTTNEVQNGQDFSQTNVQQEGIDESDIVKTDGDYIYKLTSKNVIEIVDIRADEMRLAGEIAPELSEVDKVCDMYVDGDFLYVVLSQYGTGLYSTDLVSDYSLTDTYYRDINQTSELLTYDISVHSQPKLIGTLTQDGEYYTSRKVGDYIYLFTRKYIDSYYYTDADVETVVPMVQGQKVEYGNIYLSENPYMELIAASIDVNQPEKVVDDLVIMDNYSTVYMGTSAIYFYRSSYENGQEMTEFTKFSYKDGQMYPVADNMVKGDITDTFAISQHGDMLRVLTTDWSGPTVQNRLYILDANLNVLGEIEHIADGESIYAARYVENTAYFITYRNTDPLFVADLTDCESPTLLGCVEVSGFSESLHILSGSQ